jgi:uncharacterized membrane protein
MNNPLHILIMILLCVIIIGGIKIPSQMYPMVGTVPGIILIMGIVFYLFTISPILGIFAMIAGYQVVMNSKPNKTNEILRQLVDESNLTPNNQFQVTLEETIVKNIVPLVQSVTPKHLNFKYSEDNTYSAANAV